MPHTPGPWRRIEIEVDGNKFVHCINGADDTVISGGTVYGRSEETPGDFQILEVADEDLQLIEAAPELLERLEDCVAAMRIIEQERLRELARSGWRGEIPCDLEVFQAKIARSQAAINAAFKPPN